MFMMHIKKETFNLQAMLMWTISDFLAYGNLFGCTVKGYYACPICGIDTCACWLPHSKKKSHMGHCRFLPLAHPFRKLKKIFNGKQEWNDPPKTLSGQEIFNRKRRMEFLSERLITVKHG